MFRKRGAGRARPLITSGADEETAEPRLTATGRVRPALPHPPSFAADSDGDDEQGGNFGGYDPGARRRRACVARKAAKSRVAAAAEANEANDAANMLRRGYDREALDELRRATRIAPAGNDDAEADLEKTVSAPAPPAGVGLLSLRGSFAPAAVDPSASVPPPPPPVAARPRRLPDAVDWAAVERGAEVVVEGGLDSSSEGGSGERADAGAPPPGTAPAVVNEWHRRRAMRQRARAGAAPGEWGTAGDGGDGWGSPGASSDGEDIGDAAGAPSCAAVGVDEPPPRVPAAAWVPNLLVDVRDGAPQNGPTDAAAALAALDARASRAEVRAAEVAARGDHIAAVAADAGDDLERLEAELAECSLRHDALGAARIRLEALAFCLEGEPSGHLSPSSVSLSIYLHISFSLALFSLHNHSLITAA